MRKFFFATLAIALVGIFFLYSRYQLAVNYALDPDSSARVSVIIPEGSTGTKIAEILKKEALISNANAFSFYLKQNDLSNQLKAGNFIFQENFTMPEIVNVLVEGKSAEFSITLLEGWTAKQIAEKLESEGLTTVDDFMNCLETCEFTHNFLPEGYLEGYLYPDTYFVNSATYSDEAFIERLLNTFSAKLDRDDWSVIDNSERSFEDIIIMASIIEREERIDSEKATISGILWNRYDAGVGLGADATVLYALGRTSGGLTYDDLQIESPYNTRKYAGLPPTPIANPSASSIKAALYPEETDYWYYLHDSDGQIHYAETLERHNINKAKYIQ